MELSEEEKKAIKDFLKVREIHSNDSMTISYLSIYQNAVKKMLNLVDNQQKEIKFLEKLHYDLGANYIELDEKYKQQQEEIEVLKEDLDKKVKALDIAMSNPDYISKDKIREFIKEELPDDEIMKWNIIYDVNGIDLRIKLEKMLEEK